MTGPPILLSIVEFGGYPNFAVQYAQAGYQVVRLTSLRKALAFLKKSQPAVIVTEFNFQSDFRDRTSSLESLMATVQSRCPQAKVVVFYDREHLMHLDKVRTRFSVHAALPYPIELDALMESIRLPAVQE
jgi:DNA-binding NtrC family response regulator